MVREHVLLDLGWKFKLADAALLQPYEKWLLSGGMREGVPAQAFDDATWRNIDLPHDFVVEGQVTCDNPTLGNPESNIPLWRGAYPTGVGWYRRRFPLAEQDETSRIYLLFDGIFRDSRIYLNEFFIGRHASGYTSFYYDVTDAVQIGGENLLVVRADASQPEGWFYEGGGIYRHVWLLKTHPLHIPPWGVDVTAKIDHSGAAPRATVRIVTEVLNKLPWAATGELVSTLVDPHGVVAGETCTRFQLAAGTPAVMEQELNIENAALWSLEHPQLYYVTSTIHWEGNIVDTQQTTTGLRSIRFDANEGFFLNEEPVKIKGVCCHQDHAGVGSAVPDGLQAYRITLLKEMGCNAYRTAHHPPTPELLDACDRLGMLVMDENRRLSSAEEDLADLSAMVRRDRHHPSVIMWSLGNEEVAIQWQPQAGRIARTLMERVHALDPSRPVTVATCYWDPTITFLESVERRPSPVPEVDLMGFNYADSHWQEYHARYPAHPIIISETSSDSPTRGCYTTDNARGYVGYQPQPGESGVQKQWAQVAEHAFFSGFFLWTGFDYRGEPLPAGWPAVSSNFGIMDSCGFPKDNYYYYQAEWRSEPVLHLFPHWNWPDRLGEPITVGCCSNCDEVELFLNGASLGRQRRQAYSTLAWPNVPYAPGELLAHGYRVGAQVATARIETTGAPQAVRLTPWYADVAAWEQDLCVVNIAIVDDAGRVVPTAENEVVLQLEGPARLLGVGNGNPSSHEADQATFRRAFNGYCQAIIQLEHASKATTLTASAAGLQQHRLRLTIKERIETLPK